MNRIMRNLLLSALLIAGAPIAHADLDVGQNIPRFDIERLEGGTLRSGELDDKVVMVMFWATWCPICLHELPAFQKLYETYRKQGLEIVALSLDREKGEVVDFWRQRKYAFPVAMRMPGMREAYGDIKGTPTLFLFDRKGQLRLKHLGGIEIEDLERRLRQLL